MRHLYWRKSFWVHVISILHFPFAIHIYQTFLLQFLKKDVQFFKHLFGKNYRKTGTKLKRSKCMTFTFFLTWCMGQICWIWLFCLVLAAICSMYDFTLFFQTQILLWLLPRRNTSKFYWLEMPMWARHLLFRDIQMTALKETTQAKL